MPTVTIFATADTVISSTHATYATCRAGSGLAVPGGLLYIGHQSSSHLIKEAFLAFDTSTVTGPTAVALSLVGHEWFGGTFTIEARLHDWGAPPATTADWVAGDDLGSKTLLATLSSANFNWDVYVPFTESGSAFAANLNLSGITRLVLCSEQHRVGTSSPGNYLRFSNIAHSGGTTTDPKIVVTYSTGGGGGLVKTSAGVTKPTKIFPGGVTKPVKFKDGGGAWVLA